MAKSFRHSKDWGGKREGAGRPTDAPTKTYSLTLPEELVEQFDLECGRQSIPRSTMVAQLIEQYLQENAKQKAKKSPKRK